MIAARGFGYHFAKAGEVGCVRMRADVGDVPARALNQFLRGERGHEHGCRVRVLHPLAESGDGVEIRRRVAADFVANLPITDAIGRAMDVDRAFGAPGCSGVAVAVLDQISGALRAVGETQADQRLRADQFTELAELINAYVV